MSGHMFNRALYRLTRIPMAADPQPAVEALSRFLGALLSDFNKPSEEKALPPVRRRRSKLRSLRRGI